MDQEGIRIMDKTQWEQKKEGRWIKYYQWLSPYPTIESVTVHRLQGKWTFTVRMKDGKSLRPSWVVKKGIKTWSNAAAAKRHAKYAAYDWQGI
jgi:hypothetical protein